jgi:hypothetical protein
MTAAELVGILIKQGFQLRVVRSKLNITPIDLLTDQLRQAVLAHYRDIVEIVRSVEDRGVAGIDSHYLQPQRKPTKVPYWTPGDRPTNPIQAARDLGIDLEGDWD